MPQDAHGRLGALRRSGQRTKRALRLARGVALKPPPATSGPDAVATAVAAAATTRLMGDMEVTLRAESEQLRAWLVTLETMSATKVETGRAVWNTTGEKAISAISISAAEMDCAPADGLE